MDDCEGKGVKIEGGSCWRSDRRQQSKLQGSFQGQGCHRAGLNQHRCGRTWVSQTPFWRDQQSLCWRGCPITGTRILDLPLLDICNKSNSYEESNVRRLTIVFVSLAFYGCFGHCGSILLHTLMMQATYESCIGMSSCHQTLVPYAASSNSLSTVKYIPWRFMFTVGHLAVICASCHIDRNIGMPSATSESGLMKSTIDWLSSASKENLLSCKQNCLMSTMQCIS